MKNAKKVFLEIIALVLMTIGTIFICFSTEEFDPASKHTFSDGSVIEGGGIEIYGKPIKFTEINKKKFNLGISIYVLGTIFQFCAIARGLLSTNKN